MADENTQSRELPPTRVVTNEPKRRKVRKGTQSCWECKRKKTKCTFSASTDTPCHGCKRRGVPCISQEYPEDTAGNRRQLGDRLGRVEELVGQLITDASKGQPKEISPGALQNVALDAQAGHQCSTGRDNGSRPDGPAVASGEAGSAIGLHWHSQETTVRVFRYCLLTPPFLLAPTYPMFTTRLKAYSIEASAEAVSNSEYHHHGPRHT